MYAPPPPAGKRNAAAIILGTVAAVLVCLIGAVALTEAFKAQTYSLGQPARDGTFEFVVTKVECGKPTAGADRATRTAQGQFCFVTVIIKNVGVEARNFDAGSQNAYGPGGVKYSADSLATAYQDAANTFLEGINPGNSVSGVVAFDIPQDAVITRLELHGSVFSGGVTVTL